MSETSEEGSRSGLGWIKGHVRKIDTSSLTSKPLLPHMGWNEIEAQTSHPILEQIEFQKAFTFCTLIILSVSTRLMFSRIVFTVPKSLALSTPTIFSGFNFTRKKSSERDPGL